MSQAEDVQAWMELLHAFTQPCPEDRQEAEARAIRVEQMETSFLSRFRDSGAIENLHVFRFCKSIFEAKVKAFVATPSLEFMNIPQTTDRHRFPASQEPLYNPSSAEPYVVECEERAREIGSPRVQGKIPASREPLFFPSSPESYTVEDEEAREVGSPQVQGVLESYTGISDVLNHMRPFEGKLISESRHIEHHGIIIQGLLSMAEKCTAISKDIRSLSCLV